MADTSRSLFRSFFTAVVLIQGIHVFEHIVQLVQVYLLGVPDDEALGLLGYLLRIQGTEEWLHLVFNAAYATALWLLLFPLRAYVPKPVPPWAFWVFAIFGAGLESWHVIEHGVIISHVIHNSGCPCPGIGDAALGITDTVLHFWYNAIAYLAALVPFVYLVHAPLESDSPVRRLSAGD
jgi:hypothetical protein